MNLDDFDIYRKDRPNRGGGVLIAVKRNLCGEPIPSSGDAESVFCKIKMKGKKPLIVGSVYRPPNLDYESSKRVVNDFYDLADRNKGATFWLGGDFNLPDIDWAELEIFGNQNSKNINSLFIEMAQDLGLNQVIDFPTRGTATLDLLFTNNPGFVKECSPLSGLGDHEIVSIKSSLHPFRKKPTKRKIYLWNKVDEAKLQNAAHVLKFKFLSLFSATSDVNDMWNFLKIEFTKIIEEYVPSKLTSSKCHQPWITTETKRLIRKKNRWFNLAKKLNTGKAWKRYKKIKSECQRTCRQTHDKYLNNIFEEDQSNKKLYEFLKSRKQDNIGISDLKDKNNILTSDPLKKANLIHEVFNSVFSNPSPKISANFDEKDRLPTLKPINVTLIGILKLLKSLNPNKANGPDSVPGNFLKLCAYEIAEMYQVLFQASLDQGVVPPDWKKANVVPLFKKGDKTSPENYRPISLTSLSCKILEHVVHSNIMSHFDNYNVLDDAQHGFRKYRSCVSQLISTLDDFANALLGRKQIDAILLDFSKAFDKVDHEGLILKLEHLGIRGPLLNWVRSFLIGRDQRVVVDGVSSSPTEVLSGVPQGTVLGPLFFLVYINDISQGLSKGTKLRLFADDSLLYREINSLEDSAILQRDLNLLQSWEKKWKMEFHPGKCQLLRITNKKSPITSPYFIHNIPISETDSAKYLGIIIDSNLNWRQQYASMIKKCNSTLAFIKRNLNKAPKNVKEKCYTSLVRPQIEYGSPVWDPHHQIHKENIEKVQKRAARFVTGNYKMESGNSRKNLENLGWPPLEERRLRNKLNIFQKARLKLINIPTDHLALQKRQTRRGGEGFLYQRFLSKIDSHFYSFYPQATHIWNLLPLELKQCQDINTFTSKVNNIDLMALKSKSVYI